MFFHGFRCHHIYYYQIEPVPGLYCQIILVILVFFFLHQAKVDRGGLLFDLVGIYRSEASFSTRVQRQASKSIMYPRLVLYIIGIE